MVTASAVDSQDMIHRFTSSLVGRCLRRYSDAKGSTWAIVIAWNSLLAFFPIVLVTASVLGIALHAVNPDTAQTVQNHLVDAVSTGGDSSALQGALSGVQTHTGLLGLVGLLSLMWSGASLISACDQAFNALYPCKPRSFVKQKLMSFGVILLFTVLTVPLVLSGTILTALENVSFVPDWLHSTAVTFPLQFAFGVIDGAVLLCALYYIIPYRIQKFRRVFIGAFVGGVLLELFTLLFPLYVQLSHGFNRYGQQFALFFLLLSYFYFVGQIVMLGASINATIDPEPGKCVEEEEETRAGGLANAEDAAPTTQQAPDASRPQRQSQAPMRPGRGWVAPAAGVAAVILSLILRRRWARPER